MIAEGFEYFLQDETEFQEKIDSDNHGYCPTCGSCGETGCCSPTKCAEVVCYYGKSNIRDYEELLNENTELRDLLQEVVDIFWFGIEPNDDDFKGYTELYDRIKKFVDMSD